MNNIEQLQQQQGYLTAQQVAAYQNARNGYLSAQAALSQASAANISANATQNLDAAQAAYYNQQVQEAKNSTGANSGSITISGNNPTQASRNSSSILGSLQGGFGNLQGGNYGGIQ
jgi:CTP synthase (UTP-ammonia lyase)